MAELSGAELSTKLAATLSESLIGPMPAAIALSLVLLVIMAIYKGVKRTFSPKMVSGLSATIGLMVFNAMLIPLIVLVMSALQALYAALGIPSVPVQWWASHPLALTVVVAMIMADFIDYWNHRLMHTRWFWPIHAIHHSDEEMNGLTTFRVHVLEAIQTKAATLFFMSWLGIPPEAVAVSAFIMLLHNVYVHANINWSHGPFEILIASPRFHRWHHADDKVAYGKNLANMVPLWDRLFGTYYDPYPCTGPLGAKGVPHDNVVGLVLYPFAQWRRELRRELEQRRPVHPLSRRGGR